MMWLAALMALNVFETSLYSRGGEDGALASIYQTIPPKTRYCVDIGAGDGITNNHTYLLRLQGWDGLLLDRAYEIPEYNLHKEFVTAENINQLFEKYHVPEEFALLAIDIHYNDYHVWKALASKYRPQVVTISYNSEWSGDEVAAYHPYYCGNGSNYYGASAEALEKLGREKGYSLIYADNAHYTLFFLRDEQ